MLRFSRTGRAGFSPTQFIDNLGSYAMDVVGKSLPSSLMLFTSHVLFWPTLLWNEFLVRSSGGSLQWSNQVYVSPATGGKLFLGGFPWRPEILNSLELSGVHSVLSVVDEREAKLPRHFRSFRVPMRDFAQPDLNKVQEAVEIVRSEIAAGRSVYLHCKAGKGRSATVGLCFLLQQKQAKTPEEAAAILRTARPQILGNIGTRRVVSKFFSTLNS